MRWLSHAPANIALIKYMGKSDPMQNLPTNPSLSYTTENLITYVELEKDTNHDDLWEPLEVPGGLSFQLTTASQQRFLAHLKFLKKQWEYDGSFVVRSCNNFPSDVGLASSASSFAALTQCTAEAIAELTGKTIPPPEVLARLSQQGSGSSCRSFFTPWALWDGERCTSFDLPYRQLTHQVIIAAHDRKMVPSSEAHQRVLTSPDFAGRPERAQKRLDQLIAALQGHDWHHAYEIVWAEFEDMHHLFKTANPSFHYQTDSTYQILDYFQHLWESTGDGPLVTIDAGPNVHALYRPDQSELALEVKQTLLRNYDII